jgi:DNA-binding MarR family transcriptional regulator
MTRKATTPGPRYEALLQLLRTAEGLWNASHALFAHWGLSPSQFNLLNLLHPGPSGASQVELSRELIMHRSNVTGLVDRLQARGLVERRERAGDRRSYEVVLTPAGSRLVSEILPHYYAAAERVWGDVPAARAGAIAADLERVLAHALDAAKDLGDRPPAEIRRRPLPRG